MPDPMRIGIVGAGAVTQVAHLPVLRRLKGVVVTAICDNDLAKAKALADRFQIPIAVDDIEEMLRLGEFDAVLICTPNHLHESHAIAALSADLNVMVERPLAPSAATALRIVKAAEKRGRLLMASVAHRYRPDVQIVRSFVQSGELGEIESVRGSWHTFRPGRAQLGWRLRRDEAGGGAMLDLGYAILDLAFWLANTPAPIRVSASLDQPASGKAVETSGSAFVVCEGGVSFFVDVTWHHIGEGERFGVGIRGSKGTAGINPLHVWKELNGVPTDVAPTGSVGRENPFIAATRAQWAHFLAAIEGTARPSALQEQVTLLRVLDAIYRSAADGRDITL
jgi:predicted dehydrogenase